MLESVIWCKGGELNGKFLQNGSLWEGDPEIEILDQSEKAEPQG